MFNRLLIANRGEIACRVMATARRLGIRTIAVYSAADANARHVRLADEAYAIGGAPAAESYLRGEAILDVARRAGAEAIHPGYGFLAENADFARACTDAGLAFIGPPAEAIRAMGSKVHARQLMTQAGVAVIPGYHEANLDLKVISTEARKMGYPVMIKASAGGGGRGIRVVTGELDLQEAVKSARREAQAAFGDDRILLEKCIAHPRHIEIQLFADGHGNVIHLFERDCSIQRRHQKVIEEAPGATVRPELRELLAGTAVAVARAIGYVGAGTVEFVVDREDNFYFLEMNTRIQVEHTVTEMITGQDLVEWQLRIAAGDPLPLVQEQLVIRGHAIEARLYAEDPARDFMPAPGRLAHLRLPAAEPGLRIESGLETGDVISPHYDSMIAKLIAWDADRTGAIRTLQRALAETQIAGVATNLGLLTTTTAHPAFAAGEIDTGFIAHHREMLIPEARLASDRVLALAALYLLLDRAARATAAAAASGDPHSPWARTDNWRMNETPGETLILIDHQVEIAIGVTNSGDGYLLTLPDGEMAVAGRLVGESDMEADLGGVRVHGSVVRADGDLTVWLDGTAHRLGLRDPLAVAAALDQGAGALTAPMPGRITRVLVDDGAEVARGATLLVLEAMKMEHSIAAPGDGRVEKVNFALGDWVEEGAALLDFTPSG